MLVFYILSLLFCDSLRLARPEMFACFNCPDSFMAGLPVWMEQSGVVCACCCCAEGSRVKHDLFTGLCSMCLTYYDSMSSL